MPVNTLAAKQALESKLQDMINPAGWRDCIAVHTSADPADTTQQIVDRDMATRNLNHNASLLRDIRAALSRIQDGVYGLCLDCDEPISPKRLEAVPWASRCLSCQESAEVGGAEDQELAA